MTPSPLRLNSGSGCIAAQEFATSCRNTAINRAESDRAGVGGAPTRTDRRRAHCPARAAGAGAAPGEVRVAITCCGVCRTDLHLVEGDLAAATGRRHAGPRGGRSHRRARGRRRGSRSATGSGSPGWADRWQLPVLPARTGEPLRRSRPSPVGMSTAATPTAAGRRAFRVRLPDGLADEQAAPLLCAGIIGYRALIRAAGSTGRAARHLRLRRQRASHRPGRTGPGTPGACADPRRAQSGARPRAGRRLGRCGRRPTARAAGRGHPVRAGRRTGTVALRALDRGGPSRWPASG